MLLEPLINEAHEVNIRAARKMAEVDRLREREDLPQESWIRLSDQGS